MFILALDSLKNKLLNDIKRSFNKKWLCPVISQSKVFIVLESKAEYLSACIMGAGGPSGESWHSERVYTAHYVEGTSDF